MSEPSLCGCEAHDGHHDLCVMGMCHVAEMIAAWGALIGEPPVLTPVDDDPRDVIPLDCGGAIVYHRCTNLIDGCGQTPCVVPPGNVIEGIAGEKLRAGDAVYVGADGTFMRANHAEPLFHAQRDVEPQESIAGFRAPDGSFAPSDTEKR